MPHIAEEIWHKLGGEELVIKNEFPQAVDIKYYPLIDLGEELIKETVADVENVIKLTGKTPKYIFIYTAGSWKHKVYEIIRREKAFDKIMKTAAQDPELKVSMNCPAEQIFRQPVSMNDVQRVTKQLIKNAHSLHEKLSDKEEYTILNDAIDFFKKQFSCDVFVLYDTARLPNREAGHEKAKNALPNKPAIVLE